MGFSGSIFQVARIAHAKEYGQISPGFLSRRRSYPELLCMMESVKTSQRKVTSEMKPQERTKTIQISKCGEEEERL